MNGSFSNQQKGILRRSSTRLALTRPASRAAKAAPTAAASTTARREARRTQLQTSNTRVSSLQKNEGANSSLVAYTSNNVSKHTTPHKHVDTLKSQIPNANRVRRSGLNPMSVKLDLAGNIGLLIDTDTAQPVTAVANAEYLSQMDEDEYGSDDDLGDSEATQAARMQTVLVERIANTDKEQQERLIEADRKDYEANGEVLDHEIIMKRLQSLSSFALHLRQIGKNRASLLARLAEPMAEEHWTLDAAYHQRIIDVLQHISGIVNRLPAISAGARHCINALLPEKSSVPSEGSEMENSAYASGRRIAQMERLVHEVEQAIEWVEAGKMTDTTMPPISL
ncbi:hypothetical protein GGI25_002808 [Coemansia spiralis]|uniref:Uncharacterized protein n=2 Tax=Coemansia TaxID=4863 RepID=A0A9W8G761_9FUNG|nr:hypothetical protein BX070DRAFT_225124 [Coemansia spiralis]KAJ1989381.1 hypothetical protein EDC05_004710 [Coemansia umbellata]KAJ2622345.1 hypothetical protein GGI26_003356 [Coemansia sp. RSA 1358]KAJ2677856.1 hypothetical protein GGI25_002808 [Coemansia spiralis]